MFNNKKTSNGARKQVLIGGLFALGLGVGLGAIASASTVTTDTNQEQRQQIQMRGQKQGDFKGHFQMTEEKRTEMEAHREQMDAILTSGSYEAFKELVSDKPMMSDKITEANFSKFVEMHNLKQAGDIEGSKAIAEELGLNHFGQKDMKDRMYKKGMKFEDKNGDGVCDRLDREEK